MIAYQDVNLEEAISKRGEKTYGFLKVAQKADCSWVTIPVFIIAGKESGPVLVADSCTHGNEYEGGEAIGKLCQEIDPKSLKGTFIGIPSLNLEASSYGQRENHMDYSYTNMNRVFPGNDKSYITQKIAKYYCDNVVFKYADYMINFHGGGNVLYVTPQVGYGSQEYEAGRISRQMAKAFCYPCLYGGKNQAFGGTMRSTANSMGVPAITVEIGQQSTRHDQRWNHVQADIDGIYNVMRFCGMLEGEVKYLDNYIDSEESLTYLYAEHGGWMVPIKKEREFVREGEKLGEIYDLFGNLINEVVAPFDCCVYGWMDYPMVQPGNWTYLIAKMDF